MKNEKIIMANCDSNVNRYKSGNNPIIPNSSESFVWKDIEWKTIELRLNIIQHKIFAAKKNSDLGKVRKLQRLILDSYDFRKLAVRKVTQLNRGKKTAGVDGIMALNDKQRVWLVDNLKITGKASPVRRVMIPKPNGEFRPLGIPTFYDRALQALFVMALEPEFEAVFERNSYGFRPGRSPMDALKQIQLCLQNAEKFVLDADISKCFDRIDHRKLLDLVGHGGRVRRQIQAWLESGNIFEGIFENTKSGTPQGGIISPLLSNIALDGMERVLGDWAENNALYRPGGKLIDSKNLRRKSIHFIRYADDFVVMFHDVAVIEQCRELISKFLAERGLELSEAKTKIVHTRKTYKECEPGFEFLGLKIKHFDTTKHSAKNNQGDKIGYRLLTFPSRKSRKKHFAAIDDILRRYRYAKQSWIIRKLTPVIVGWTNYFRFSHFLTTKVAASNEQVLFLKLLYWAKRRLNSAKLPVKPYAKFWHKVNGKRQFAFQNRVGKYLCVPLYREVAKGISLVKYVKVKGEVSVYNGDVNYWSRRAITPSLKSKIREKLLKRQNFKCLACGKSFLPGDIIETDHIEPIARGGSHKLSNLQLLHAVCHDKKKS